MTHDKQKIIYISSPYTLGDVGKNVHVQLEAAHRILDLGHCPVAPLLTHYLHIHRQRPYEDWMAMDLALIRKMDAVLRLPGESKGADRETALAEKIGVPVLRSWDELENWVVLSGLRARPEQWPDAGRTPSEETPVNAAKEAIKLVLGDRNESYGNPRDDYEGTAKIWSGIIAAKLKADITPEEAILMMVGLKLRREATKHKDDNVIDAHGYLLCHEWSRTGQKPAA